MQYNAQACFALHTIISFHQHQEIPTIDGYLQECLKLQQCILMKEM